MKRGINLAKTEPFIFSIHLSEKYKEKNNCVFISYKKEDVDAANAISVNISRKKHQCYAKEHQ